MVHTPVEEVVPPHHAQEARGVRDRIQPVVHLLKLLLDDVSGLALCLAAGTGPAG